MILLSHFFPIYDVVTLTPRALCRCHRRRVGCGQWRGRTVACSAALCQAPARARVDSSLVSVLPPPDLPPLLSSAPPPHAPPPHPRLHTRPRPRAGATEGGRGWGGGWAGRGDCAGASALPLHRAAPSKSKNSHIFRPAGSKLASADPARASQPVRAAGPASVGPPAEGDAQMGGNICARRAAGSCRPAAPAAAGAATRARAIRRSGNRQLNAEF